MNTLTASRMLTLLPALFLGLALSSSTGICQPKADWQRFAAISITFGEHARDFAQFQQSSESDLEREIGTDFEAVADSYRAASDFIGEELLIVEMLETEPDKRIVRDLIQKRIKTSIKEINTFTIKRINFNLMQTKRPLIIAQANKLKDDLGRLQEALQTISDKLAEKEKASTTRKNQ